MRLIHDALSRIQKYFKIQPAFLHSTCNSAFSKHESVCESVMKSFGQLFSQPKRSKPTEDCCPAEIYKWGIKPSDDKLCCLTDSQALLDPESTTGTRRGGVGSDCTNCHVKARILIPAPRFHIESTNFNERVYYVTFRADWV